jgi:hypothetical protein
MGGTCSTHGGDNTFIRHFDQEISWEETTVETDVIIKMVLREILCEDVDWIKLSG